MKSRAAPCRSAVNATGSWWQSVQLRGKLHPMPANPVPVEPPEVGRLRHMEEFYSLYHFGPDEIAALRYALRVIEGVQELVARMRGLASDPECERTYGWEGATNRTSEILRAVISSAALPKVNAMPLRSYRRMSVRGYTNGNASRTRSLE